MLKHALKRADFRCARNALGLFSIRKGFIFVERDALLFYALLAFKCSSLAATGLIQKVRFPYQYLKNVLSVMDFRVTLENIHIERIGTFCSTAR